MAHFRSVGGLATLKAGETAYWETTYGNLLDEGIVTQAPNLLDESATNIEMIVLYQSVVLVPVEIDPAPRTAWPSRTRGRTS